MDFIVKNEIELGNAIWSSRKGDKIVLSSGKFGNIPIKAGVCYEFSNDSSAAEILGLGIEGNWSAGKVSMSETEIINPTINMNNIKLYYIFQKQLPFNTSFENPISFIHANGVIINILGNDKQGFIIGGFPSGSDSQLPKGKVQIIVPVLDNFDVDKADPLFQSSIYSKNLSSEEMSFQSKLHKLEIEKKNNIEKNTENRSIGLSLNEMAYKGLWALNSFIREYCMKTNQNKINGFSIPEFMDGLEHVILKKLSEKNPSRLFNYINYTNATLDKTIEIEIFNSMLNSKEYSISDFIDYHLNQLNYSFATISMYQEFESEWINFSPNQQDKWGFVENYISDNETKGNLAEMINARNNILHSNKLMTSDNPPRNKLKTDWGASVLNEFEIYAHKKPFKWNVSLKRLKYNIQHSV